MSSDTFQIGLSALTASQRGLATTGHNIANVNTNGFSRQRVTFETRNPQFVGVGVAEGVDLELAGVLLQIGCRRVRAHGLEDSLLGGGPEALDGGEALH